MNLLGTAIVFCTVGAALSASDPALSGCPDNIEKNNYLKVFDKYCFQFNIKDKRDYQDARDKCRDRGGNLAMPKTAQLQNFITKELKNFGTTGKVWIGLDDEKLESTFRWVDGSLLSESFVAWAEGNGPRDGVSAGLEDCVVIDPKDFLWHDYFCESPPFTSLRDFYYICQFDKK